MSYFNDISNLQTNIIRQHVYQYVVCRESFMQDVNYKDVVFSIELIV